VESSISLRSVLANNIPLESYLSNGPSAKGHKKNNKSNGIPFSIVKKVETSQRNSMIGDISAVPMQP
jgi:hypothetical protein